MGGGVVSSDADDDSSMMLSESDKVLCSTVNQIWAEYDQDGNGSLDKEEMQSFIHDILVESGLIQNYTDRDFNRVFSMFDRDGDEKISRNEMFLFIK